MTDAKEDFTWRQKRYARWLSLPSRRRPEDCKTHVDYSVLTNVCLSTLRAWRRLPGFWDLVYQEAHEIIGMQVPTILESIAREAKAGSMTAARLALEILGLLEERAPLLKSEDSLTVILTLPAPTPTPSLPVPVSDVNIIDASYQVVEDANIQSEP